MPDNTFSKDLAGFEDLFFDSAGVDASFSRKNSTGAFQNIKGLNSSHLPLLLATRTLELYDSVNMSAEEVDEAITQICASLASIHKFDNQDILDDIDSAGSGAIITSQERDKLNEITKTGSGEIITDSERSKLDQLIGLTQAQIDAITNVANILPVGTLIGFPTTAAPSGFLECNGNAISRVTYSDLFGLIGTSYGVGNGTTTFNLPDYRGEFLRGWDHGAGSDPDAGSRTDRGDGITTGDNIGTKQGSELLEHFHETGFNNGPNDLAQFARGTSRTVNDRSNYTSNTDFSSTDLTGGSESRPRNINVMWCIRYSIT